MNYAQHLKTWLDSHDMVKAKVPGISQMPDPVTCRPLYKLLQPAAMKPQRGALVA